MMNQIRESIFRAYDIRGIVASELQDDVITRIASAFATVFINHLKTEKKSHRGKIVVAMDGRPSSPHIKRILVSTLVQFGLEVIDIGLVPTPVMYFALTRLDLDGGIMITASHNPAEYNGFKTTIGTEPQTEEQVQEIYRIASTGNFHSRSAGSLIRHDILEEYLGAITNHIKLAGPVTVVVDAGNGTAGITAPQLYRKLGATVIPLYCEVDGSFPNHYPDPSKLDNLASLIKKVKESHADAGIAYDGDGDRISVVAPDGTILWGDQLTTLFVQDILPKHPGATVISEVKASQVLFDQIKKHGGKAIMWKTGYTYIKQKLKEHRAVLAGEMSGHIFFNDRWFGFDDAVYTGARLLELIAASERTLPQMVAALPQVYNTPEIRVKTTEEGKFKIVSHLLEHFSKDYPVIDIDGVRVTFPHGWAVVRVSNTQPILVIRFEADSPDHLRDIRRQVLTVIEETRKHMNLH